METKISFWFANHVAPRYLQPLFLQFEYGIWYSSVDMREMLHQNGIPIEGSNITGANIDMWSLLKLGEKKVENAGGRKNYFKINQLGKQFQEIYSTNQELFFDLMHYMMYSAWQRTKNPRYARLWLYASVCNNLWDSAPSATDSLGIAGSLQVEAQKTFPKYEPKFPERSITAVFPWLGALTPPFLIKETSRPQLFSKKRQSCSPQLFHLALDLLYCEKQLKYGTSVAIGENEIRSVCRVCLLDDSKFWEMADRTRMFVRGVDIRRGQFSTSIALEMKPQWIDLPEYTDEIEFDGFEGEEE